MTNPSHLRTILADIEEHRSSYLMHMGGNDLGSRGNAIDNVLIGLTALLTQIRVKFHISHIHACEKKKKIDPETESKRVVLANTKLTFQYQQVGFDPMFWVFFRLTIFCVAFICMLNGY